jgi:CRP-like cAMP-binding protein
VPDSSKKKIEDDDSKKGGFSQHLSKLKASGNPLMATPVVKKELTDEEFLARNFPEMRNVFVFKPGMAFGEIALLTKSNRTATMVACQDTHLMTLSKQAFDQITGAHKEQILQEKISFLRLFPFFTDIVSSSLMANVLQYVEVIHFKNK